MLTSLPPQNATSLANAPLQKSADPLTRAAKELETVFLAEMLKSAGLHKSPAEFGGGAGEDQFQSLLVRAQAEEIVGAGGFGLAETLFHALKGQGNGQ